MKSLNDLNLTTKKIKKEADLLLKKSKLIECLSKFGDVSIRGSYELDLMLDGDIDIYVVSKKINKNYVLKILNKLIMDEKFNGYFFYDFYKKTRKCFPKGYYIGLKTVQNKRRWKVDIWFMEKMDKSSDSLIKSVKEKLDEKNRKQILKLKYYCKNNNINIPSHQIYLAVMEHSINTVNDLKNNLDKIKKL
jgi:hypothetical protein